MMNPKPLLPRMIEGIVERHNLWRRTCLNLIASENVMSPRAERLYVNDMMHRYAEGKPRKRYYQGTRFVDELEEYVTELAKKVFNAAFADVRPISGSIANFSTFYALKRKGILANVGLSSGAHITHELGAQALGYKVFSLPFDVEAWNVDIESAVKMIEREEPDVVVLGASLYLFPHPVKEIAEAVHAVDGHLVHDSAHVLGLHLGTFPNPLENGADVVTASTHKTFPGPQGGIILAREKEKFKKIYKTTFPVFVSNHHLHRLAALGATLEEMERHGAAYAKQIVKNARALAQALYERGWNVMAEPLGFTKTHQVAVDVRDKGGGKKVAETLEQANIIVNKNMLPWDKNPKEPTGIRIGVQEMTRYGMKETDMEYIAELMTRAMGNPERVKADVIAFRSEFQEVVFWK